LVTWSVSVAGTEAASGKAQFSRSVYRKSYQPPTLYWGHGSPPAGWWTCMKSGGRHGLRPYRGSYYSFCKPKRTTTEYYRTRRVTLLK
jgi:hypothetical protein